MKDFLIKKLVGFLIFGMDQWIRDWNLNIIITREKMLEPTVTQKGDQLLFLHCNLRTLHHTFPPSSSPYQSRTLPRRVKNVTDIESF
ncbi:MAG: hypothetical protein PVF58_07810 [Candidatus Methanofastidiosia archaeon]|jgi:hypothetical protein